MISKRKARWGVVAGIVAIATITMAFDEDLFLVSKNLDIFTSLYKEININYVDDVKSAKLMRKGIDAMLDDLDPYTEYVPESEIEDYKLKYVSTQYGGIGAAISSREGKVFVSELYEGFPAQKADVRPGDQLLEVNGVSLKGKESAQVSQLLKGPKGSPIKLLLAREGVAKPLDKNLVREEIKQKNVSYYGMLPNKVGYIKLDKFLESSAQEVRDALTELNKDNLNGVVLDLRNNGGGILQEAVKIVNLFVEKDALVVTQKGRNKEKTIAYKTFMNPMDQQVPLVVLVNSRSASASEIVAGSLQDLDRAVVVGQRSYGKGLVQQAFNLPYNSLVKITVAKYYTPSGRCIQALDYTHRNTDGSVDKVPDSLITSYKTKAGRSVYDGSGVYPDVFVKPYTYSALTQTLVSKFLINDYANRYKAAKANIPAAKNFELSDADYSGFVTYLKGKDYTYKTRAESLLNEIKNEADKENSKLGDLKSDIDGLKSKLAANKQNELNTYKDEVKRILENEIVSRYYFEKGRAEQSFQHDLELGEAMKLFGNKTQLMAILKGEGSYKVIGKPKTDLAAVGK